MQNIWYGSYDVTIYVAFASTSAQEKVAGYRINSAQSAFASASNSLRWTSVHRMRVILYDLVLSRQ